MPKILSCDVCGSSEDVNEDYDGLVLCGYHRAEDDLRYAHEKYKEKREWVKSVWLSKLAKMRKDISRLEKIVGQGRDKK